MSRRTWMNQNNKGLSSFISSWVPRVLCLFVAVIIFACVRYFNMGSRVVRIPLSVTLPDSAVVTPESLVPDSIDIVISGDDNLIYLVDPDSISASADFSDVDSDGISRRSVNLVYPDDVFADTALTVRSDPDVVRILFTYPQGQEQTP